MKRLFLSILPVVAIAFNACKRDEGGNDNGTEPGTKTGTKTETTKLVKRLAMPDDDMIYSLEYDDQRRTSKATILEEGIATEINLSYSGNTITSTCVEGVYKWTGVYTLNSDGCVVKFDSQYDDADSEQDSETEKYSYSGGNWTKSTGDAWFGDADLTWKNGNIVKVSRDWGEYSDSGTYTYTDIEDKMNIVVCDMDSDMWFGAFPFFISKFKVMASKNLMSEKRCDPEDKYTYYYTPDSDGYQTKIVCTDSYGDKSLLTVTYY